MRNLIVSTMNDGSAFVTLYLCMHLAAFVIACMHPTTWRHGGKNLINSRRWMLLATRCTDHVVLISHPLRIK